MSSRGVKTLAFVCAGGLGVITLVVAVHYLARGEAASALVALGGSTFCFGFAVPQMKIIPGRVKPTVHFDSGGTTFRPDRGIDIPMQTAVGGGVLAAALVLVLLPIGKLAIPVPPNLRYALPVSCAIIVVVGASTLRRTISRGSTSYLRLTITGFEVAQSWRPQGADWDSVKEIADKAPRRQKQAPGTIVFVMAEDETIEMVAGAYTPGGVALRNLVLFYWRHPEARDELTDGRAAERLMAMC